MLFNEFTQDFQVLIDQLGSNLCRGFMITKAPKKRPPVVLGIGVVRTGKSTFQRKPDEILEIVWIVKYPPWGNDKIPSVDMPCALPWAQFISQLVDKCPWGIYEHLIQPFVPIAAASHM